MVKSNTMAKENGGVRERRRDARRLLGLECLQTAVAAALLAVVLARGLTAPAPAGTSTATATLVFVELLLAVAAAVVLLALGFRARMGRELVLQEIARLEATSGASDGARGGEVVTLRHPYRDGTTCGLCARARVR